jgi:imidazole glycerol-phosphate synthase subunit HisF
MLRSRIIPCLLVHNKGLVKTVKFKDPKYVGDPINAVKIFNEKDVDEIMVLDIDASVEHRGPNFDLIRDVARECRMPLCYGGGVTTVEQVKEIIKLGAEKVAISSAAIEDPSILSAMSNAVGAQSIVLVLDVAKKGIFGHYELVILNGKKRVGIKLKDFLEKINNVNIGEIVLNSMDRDGTMLGYDYELIDIVRDNTDLPLTVIGGAKELEDISELIKKYKIIGAAAGSMFVFKGKYRAVLINYPTREEKHILYNLQ